jgi:glycosyltransferase involved in cell wall biosynthesis
VVKHVAFAVPGDLATPTGGYAYDRHMIAELKNLGWQVDVVDLGDGFPRPSNALKMFAEKRLTELPGDCPIVIDGLALGVLPEAARAVRSRRPVVALVHHPLALESGLSIEDADQLRISERAALAAANAVVVTSAMTARLLAMDYDVPESRMTVARPGTNRGEIARGSADGVVRLLSVGALVERKGFDVLIAALATLADLPWRLAIAGDRTRNHAVTARLEADVARNKLGTRVSMLGAVPEDRLAALYAGADVFVLASRFEGFGMAYAEAIAHGLPVIGTTGGATPETVPADAGILVPPDDTAALSQALRRVIADRRERQRLSEAARSAAAALPTWRESAKLFAAVIETAA